MRSIAKTIKLYHEVKENKYLLLHGIVVSIDPSIGSRSSQPGYAVYQQGELLTSGTFHINPSWTIPQRLQELARLLRNLYQQWKVDVLVHESLPSSGQGWNANSYASLLKAYGAILSVPGPRAFVGIHPRTWRRLTTADYIKSDEEDAKQMGKIVINLAKEAQDEEEDEEKAKAAKAEARKSKK